MSAELPEFPFQPPTEAEVANAEQAADLMRRAADRIERIVVGVPVKSWDYDVFADGEPWVVLVDEEFDGDDVPVVATLPSGDCGYGDTAAWIALVNPTIAAPLVELLRAGADDAIEIGPDFRLVALARALLSVPAGGGTDV